MILIILCKKHKIRGKNVSQEGLISHSSDYQASTLSLDHKSKGASGFFFTVDQPYSVVLIIAPDILGPMPRNIFLLEPRIRSPHELGLLCLSVLWVGLTTSMSWDILSLNWTCTASVTFITGRTSCTSQRDPVLFVPVHFIPVQ